MKELILEATLENLDKVREFIEAELEAADCSFKLMMQIGIAVEEIYVNIAHYAYAPEVGQVTVRCDIKEEPKKVELEFIDSGVPFNPLEKEDADVTLPAEERPVGGLGIYMVKKSMDELAYEYKHGQNHLWIRKFIY
ncbi:MAG: ATP-binding protein [Eubacteriales bacterium]|nr:ATP-binding protein [Eubacteriales bacterium]